MIRHLLSAVLGTLTFASCASQYDIAGNSTLEEVDGHTLYLRVLGQDADMSVCAIDSCRVVHGRFRFGGEMDSVMFAQVCLGNEIMMPIVLENGALQVTIDPMGQHVMGGALNKRLYDFLQKRDRLENQLWDAEQECIRTLRHGNCNIHETHERLRRKSDKLNNLIQEAETRFVEENYSNALGPGYFMLLCNQQISPVLTEQIRRIADGAPEGFLSHPFIHNYLHSAGYEFKATPRLHRVKR